MAAVLRPGKRPTGAENAMIMRRVLTRIRRHFPDTYVLVRGDGHFSGPELMQLIDDMPNMDFIFGFPGNVKLQALAEPTRQRACALWASVQTQDVVPESVRVFDEFPYAARSWPKPWRMLLKAEVMAQGENRALSSPRLSDWMPVRCTRTSTARAARLRISSSI